MGYLTDSLHALRMTLRNTLRPPTTVEFPQASRVREVRYRTNFALLHGEKGLYGDDGEELCVGCLACERICPSQIIKMSSTKRESPITGKKRGYLDDFTLDMTACIFCELCVQVCPFDAIVMLQEPEVPGFAREDLVLTKDKLFENEKKVHTWGTGTKLMEMQEPPKAPAPEAAKPEAAKTEAS